MVNQQQLVKEVRSDNTEKVLELIEGEENLIVHDKKGKSLLHLAIENQNIDILQELIKVVDISELNYQLKSGETPLFYCLDYGFWQGLEILLQNENIDIGFQDESDMSVLHHAVVSNSVEALKVLFKYKQLEINQQCSQGSILHVALQNQSLEAGMFILENAKELGIDILCENKEGNTIFQLAVIEGSAPILQESLNYLTKYHSEDLSILNNKNQNGNTLLHEAYQYKRVGIINSLLEQQSKLNIDTKLKNKQGQIAEEIGQQIQKEKEEQKEQEVIHKREVKEQAKLNREKQKQEEREAYEEQLREQERKKEREIKIQQAQEQIEKKGKFLGVVLFIIFFAIGYLFLKKAASKDNINYID